MTRTLPIALLLAGALTACGRPVTESDLKLAGVGLNPDDIGPAPEPSGGLIEYDRINFAGGGLSLGAIGLLSYEEVGPAFANFRPPYAAIYGLAFIFDEEVPGADAHHGSIGIPPGVEDSCWTNFEPFSYLMASTVEMGDALQLSSEDGETAFSFGRVPEIYPPDPQDIFVYYSSIESAHTSSQLHWAEQEDGSYAQQTLRPANWTPGETLSLSYPGGLPPEIAPVSSIPLPSSTMDTQTVTLPGQTSGLSITWNGTQYDGTGAEVGEGELSTCVQYLGEAAESSSFDDDCLTERLPAEDEEELTGQIYTGPWDTDDGEVTFNWEPGSGDGEKVILNVRFLGPVDQTDASYQIGVVSSGNDYRDPLSCEDPDDIEWIFDPNLEDNITMEGDPFYNLAEVSCLLADDGSFTLSNEHLADAMAYAQRKGAEGSMFYFSRSTTSEVELPPVKDQAGFKRDIEPVTFWAHSVDVGRFWLEDAADLPVAGGSN